MEQTHINHTVVRDFFSKHSLGTLATVNNENQPECAAVYVKFDENLNGYFVSKVHTRKFQNISKNPNVTIFFLDEERVKCGEFSGTAEVIEGTAEAAHALSEIQSVLSQQRNEYWIPPIAQLDAGSYVLFKLTPSYARVIDYSVHHINKEVNPLVSEILFSE